jgi:hypothetical protein
MSHTRTMAALVARLTPMSVIADRVDTRLERRFR